ncbi:ANTAR domain-containing protein [Streptomyces sp. NPDC046939]|uniref:ANTAR domain-containing protein n=1 Tax=Streptomyces sp. NPDC046939 TaxID=3155376 RepID=UPI0033F842D8
MACEEAARTDAPKLRDFEARVAALQREVAQLKEAVDAYREVERALGVLVAVARIPPARAAEMLRDISVRTHIEFRRVAFLLTQWGHTRVLPPVLEAELERQVRAGRGRPSRGGPVGGDRHAG